MNRWMKLFLQAIIVVAVPIVLVVTPIRALMHPRWIYFEYGRADFPADLFGFTLTERTRLAILGVESIIGPRGVAVLQEARLSDGSPAFTEREIAHMQDVRVVTGNIYLAQATLLIVGMAAAIVLAWRPQTRSAVPAALQSGAFIAIILLIVMVVFVLTAFNTFFTAFHHVFFTGDTWLFNYSDTLIRLYPPQFWFDVATVIGAASLIEALVVYAAAWRWGKVRKQPAIIEEKTA